MGFDQQPTTLGAICNQQGGTIQTGPFGSQLHASDYSDSGTPVVMPLNLANGIVETSGIARVAPEHVQRLSRHCLVPGDIIFSRRGDVTRFALITERERGWLCGTGCLKVSVGEPALATANFIAAALASPDSKEWLIRHAVGATMPNLNTGILGRLPISLPPIAIQEDITQILGALNDRLQLLRKTNTTLEAIAQALFKSWFVDFDPVHAKAEGREPEAMNAATAAMFPSEFESSELGLIPKGWKVMPLLDACDLQGGGQPPASTFIDAPRVGYVRLLQIRDFSSDAHHTYIPESQKLKIAQMDDILIGRYGSASGDKQKDSLGRICRGLVGAYNVALMKLAPIAVGREFALQLFNDQSFYNYLQGVSAKAVQSGFSKKELALYKVVVPSDDLLAHYESMGAATWQRVKLGRQRMATLTALRDTLLPRLISGKLRLPDAKREIEAVV